MNRRAVVPLLAVAVLGLTSCSIVPTSSPTVQITQAPERPSANVITEPLSPITGATPEEIVRGFIDASASTVRGHPVAVEHLTPDAAASWSDAGKIWIISRDYATVASEAGTVAVSANLVGTIDERGVFAVAGAESFTRQFSLVQIDGEWRITNPPDGLIMLQLDFERLYDTLDAYFLDPTGQRLVPDPRHLISGEAQPTALVERLLEGPSAALAPGVRNPLAGAQLARTVTIEGQTAVVDLVDVDVEPGPALAELCAQITWTLEQLDDFRITSVTISIEGEVVRPDDVPRQQTTDDWAQFDPDAAPVDAVGHYLDNGVLRTLPEGAPAPGQVGDGGYGLTSAAVAADTRTRELTVVFGVRPDPAGARLWAGPYGGDLSPLPHVGGAFTPPTVAATGTEAWTVRDGTEILRVPAGAPAAQGVVAPDLPNLGRVQVLELSPDGVRAAVVIAGAEGSRLYLGTVVRSDPAGIVEVRGLREVAPSLGRVVDVAWRTAGELWALGDTGEGRIGPYSVGVDGWGLLRERTNGLPGEPTSLAAAPGRQPLVVANGFLWQRSGVSWVTLIRGRGPLPGSAPFFPL
ncbi:LpqB family beta-propeller domain-containing protein [Blastococcus sp. CCUG 61487]|uniref:LpqB family beta-propeller domain-containing protein n=1 Tax=Blastococcus sp. CCUG 61487 TaxID=1840703 RepID=UPI0010C0DD03|nr:LpqB family beta-propeller domain-containing protein [Blastococcus sp. CCUG 61487]TKJ16726.1 hypothetical protein A6V29_13430 [Blastococcus sp. CCUG 61487]